MLIEHRSNSFPKGCMNDNALAVDLHRRRHHQNMFLAMNIALEYGINAFNYIQCEMLN